ncbi:hypothetical protein QFC21_002968 [Naganishia friedmannii]|uniref:Uncharacterized protein n=1 Tax=Naganishia friedmannii TaxID=89922 RepID=A0ACC2VUJ3_9TREE|nr:hypothetical protein QFC21_002968 [Naganishia friedmannii]
MPQTLKAAIDEMMAITLNQEDVAVEHVPEKAPRITIQPRHVPALSAWLLEYPVGYTFSDDSAAQQTNDDTPGGRLHRAERTNLDGEPLVLVKVKILGDKELGKREHIRTASPLLHRDKRYDGLYNVYLRF